MSTQEPKAAGSAASKSEIRIFVSYSHADSAARSKLETHLAQIKRDAVVTWHDGDIQAGDALDPTISRALREAHIFIALLSPDYLASNYCWNIEYKRAMSRRARGHLRVVAVVVRHCDWKATRVAGFKLLPRDGKPITDWKPADKAYLNVIEGTRIVIAAARKELASKSSPSPKTLAGNNRRATPKTKAAEPKRKAGKSRSRPVEKPVKTARSTRERAAPRPKSPKK